MNTYYITYDIKEENDSSDIRDFIVEEGGEMLTESTYRLITVKNIEYFYDILKVIKSTGDTIYLIFLNSDYEIEDKII